MENFNNLLKELEELRLPKDKFVIFGSGPLAVRNLRDIEDLNILVKEELWKELKKLYPSNEKGYIKIGNIEIFKDWKPWIQDTKKLLEDSEAIEGLNYVKLKYVLEWKKVIGRDKDKKDIEIINKFLKN